MKKYLSLLIIALLLPLTAAAQNGASETKEAYCIFYGSTLTFYYDSKGDTRLGQKYEADLSVSSLNYTNWCNEHANDIFMVVFDNSFADFRPKSTKYWFSGLNRLMSIVGIENLNTSEVTFMTSMFSNCFDLTTLDLSGFDTRKVTDMTAMFYKCTGLTTIFVGDGWNTDKVTKSVNMFGNCEKLVGGQGTTFDETHVDKAYAHVDGGTANPGYLTKASTPPYAVYINQNSTTMKK